MFRKIKENIREIYEGAKEEQRAQVVALCEQLRLFNLDATVDESWKIRYPGWPETAGTIWGAVRVANRNIDLVELEYNRYGGGDSGTGTFYRCNCVVCARVEGLEDGLKAKLKIVGKGFLRLDIAGFRWEGKELARTLNSDATLHDMLHRINDRFLLRLEIKPYKKQQCIRIRPKDFNSSLKSAFPTTVAFEVYDRIAWHIRAIARLHGR